MDGKFSTTSSSLFNNQNKEHIPDWMQNLSDVNIKPKESMNLDIKTKGIFAEKISVNRDESIGTPRELDAALSDTKLITDAKIYLAKFLSGKYYKVQGNIKGNLVKLNVKIDGVPGDFNFDFITESNKIKNNTTFSVINNGDDGEYPFSKAGLEECLADIKANKIKTSRKVEAVGKYSVINKEEIVRRYNGHLRSATDRINELLSEGSIIGVGSNSFASTYDMDHLFPCMEKEAMESPLPAFEFAPNQEHVAANPYRPANVLAIDASKILAKKFKDHKVLNSNRNNNNLIITAKILNKNGTTQVSVFNFDICNEKVTSYQEDTRNSENKLLEAYTNKNATQTRLVQGYMFTRQLVAEKLYKIVNAETVDALIENWAERNLITTINSNSFVTDKSFQDLLASVNTKILSENEISEINELSKKSAEFEFDRIKQEDTGIRENIETPEEIQLHNLRNKVSKYFKNFTITNFNNESADLTFKNPETGLTDSILLIPDFNGSTVAMFNGSPYNLDKVASLFSKSEILAAYLQDNKANICESGIVISERNLKTKLAAYVDTNNINNIIDSWYTKGLIRNTGAGTYISDYKLEELLDKSGIEILSAEDRKQIALAKAYFGEGYNMQRQVENDTGVRELDEYINDTTLLATANDFIAQHFSSFKPESFKVNGEQINYNVALFDEMTGLTTNINFNMNFDGNKVIACNANLNGENIDIKNIKKVFASNDILNKYLQTKPGIRVKAPMLMTITQVAAKLAKIAKLSQYEINETIQDWEKTGKIDRINSNLFGSKYTFEQLLSVSNLQALNDNEIKDRLVKSMRNNIITSSHIKGSDTRKLAINLSAECMALHAKTELNKIFNDYDILNAESKRDSYIVTARVVNPKVGLRQKLTFKFALTNNKPGQILEVSNINKTVSLNDIDNLNEFDQVLNTFLKYNNPVDRNGKYIITKIQLNNLLHPIVDKTDIDNIAETLVTNNILKQITSETYASDYSASEIVVNLNTLGCINLEAGNEQLENAKRDNGMVEITEFRIMDSNSRSLENQEEILSPAMATLKEKIQLTALKAHDNKVITAKKLNQINFLLQEAKNENDLETAWKELKKYF